MQKTGPEISSNAALDTSLEQLSVDRTSLNTPQAAMAPVDRPAPTLETSFSFERVEKDPEGRHDLVDPISAELRLAAFEQTLSQDSGIDAPIPSSRLTASPSIHAPVGANTVLDKLITWIANAIRALVDRFLSFITPAPKTVRFVLPEEEEEEEDKEPKKPPVKISNFGHRLD